MLFVSLFQVSCSDDDNGATENNAANAPNAAAAVLEISQESGLSIDLTWNQVIDEDTVTYDLFTNDEIVEAYLITVDYMWTAEGREGLT